MAASDIVKKLWSLCDVLRDSGVNYANYVNELVQLMFLKMVKDHLNNGLITKDPIPEGCRFDDLLALSGTPLINAYKQALTTLSSGELADGSHIENLDPRVRAIYTDAQTSIKEPKHLEYLIKNLDEINWDSEDRDVLGAAYEGLLEKNANETKSGAGQYFTPRALINSMVKLIKPQSGEIIQDPAAGSAGFIISADRYIKNETEDLIDLSAEERTFQRTRAYEGMELVANTRRLALMNCLLHGIEGIGEGVIRLGNTLSPEGQKLEAADIILTNPPFGTAKGSGGAITRDDLTYKTSNKQLAFLQHIYRSLKPGGRAAVVFPDNVLFDSGVGEDIRKDLMEKCNLHTILRLPTGIFYAAGVQANVLFFTKGTADNPYQDKDCTKGIWIYDLRTNMPTFGKTSPFTGEHLKPFENCYGDDPNGNSTRNEGDWSFTKDEVPHEETTSRWRYFSREWIRDKNKESLDITWIKDEDTALNLDDVDIDALILDAEKESAELNDLIAKLKTALQGINKD